MVPPSPAKRDSTQIRYWLRDRGANALRGEAQQNVSGRADCMPIFILEGQREEVVDTMSGEAAVMPKCCRGTPAGMGLDCWNAPEEL